MGVDFMDEFIQIMFVPGAQVYKCLDGLIWIGREVLPLGLFDHLDDVVDEGGEVDDAVVHAC